GPFYSVDKQTPGLARITVTRNPNNGRSASEPEPLPNGRSASETKPLLTLVFRVRREGQAILGFGAFHHEQAALLDASGRVITEVPFLSGTHVSVTKPTSAPPGQRIGLPPGILDFGEVAPGASSQKSLRLSNFGFAELTI